MTVDINLDGTTLTVFNNKGKLLRLKRFKTLLGRYWLTEYGFRAFRNAILGPEGLLETLRKLSRGMVRELGAWFGDRFLGEVLQAGFVI